MTLGELALIVTAGLAGPLLAASRRAFVPVVVGEICAGIVLGRSGFDVIDTDNATVSFLAWCDLGGGAHVCRHRRALAIDRKFGSFIAGHGSLTIVET